MGNKSSCEIPKNEDTLSEYDITIFKIKQQKVFWGTIAICILFAIVALILFLASYLSENVRYVLLNRFLPFTVVFIVGTILLVSYLGYQVYYFEAVKIDRNNNFDQLSCPDYWKLERVPNFNLDDGNQRLLFDQSTNPNLFTYRCVMDDKLFKKGDISSATDGNLKIANASQTNDYSSGINGILDINKPDKYLYANLVNSNNVFVKNIANSNVNVAELMKHSLVMNNYTNLNSNNFNESKVLDFKYNIDTDNLNNVANNLGIYRINNDYNLGSTTPNELLTPETNKFLTINLTDNKKAINNIKIGTDRVTTTVTDNLPLVCDRVYPLYLATKDIELSKDNPKLDQNTLRCAYSKICGVPWTDLNCGKYNER
jgi:hypothetical protein